VLLLEANHDESLATADKAIDQDPRAVTAYLAAGRALAGKGDHENAVKKYYNPALKLAPDDAALLHARGISLWMTGKTGDAKKDLEACVAKEPKNGRFQLSLGELYYALKNYPPARTALVAAADLRPRDPEAWRALGFACTSLKDWEQAAAAFEEVVLLIEGGGAPAGGDPAAPPAPDSPPPGNGAPPAPTNPAPPGGTLPSSPGNPPPAPPAPPAQPPADPPPANPPASPPADPPAQPPAGGGDPPKAPAEPKFATNEHLWLTLLYADSLKQRDKAKAHAKKWVEQGGKNPDLDSWVQSLLSEK
jgi:tetratricopeptide (TPR) repeat protein